MNKGDGDGYEDGQKDGRGDGIAMIRDRWASRLSFVREEKKKIPSAVKT